MRTVIAHGARQATTVAYLPGRTQCIRLFAGLLPAEARPRAAGGSELQDPLLTADQLDRHVKGSLG